MMLRRPAMIAGALLAVGLPTMVSAQAAPPPAQPPQIAPADQPDAAPPSLAEAKAKDEAQTIADIAGKPVIDAKSVFQIIKLTLQDKDLLVETRLAPTDEAIVRAPGLHGLSKVRISSVPVAAPPAAEPILLQYSFENIDYATPEAVAIHTTVSQVPGKLMLSQDWDRLDDQTHSVQLIQSTGQVAEGESRVTLYVQITGTPKVDLRLGAESLVDLRRQHPAEAARYVDPIFRTLGQERLLARVDPKLAWQVFAAAFTPSSSLMRQLQAILPRLDDQLYAQRQAASRELDALGQPAALLLMRLDRRNLSAEQLSRIDAFLAQYKIVPDAEAAHLRRDRDFLLDCLYCDDPMIRRQALEQLRTVTGKTIAFDDNADPDQRLASIARLRQSIGAAPATQAKE